MKSVIKVGSVVMVLLVCLGVNADALVLNRWDCDELPEELGGGTVFSVFGSGSRHILDEEGDYGETGNVSPDFDVDDNHYYQEVTTSGNFGWMFNTQPGVWQDVDSTIEVRLMTENAIDGLANNLGIVIFSADDNKIYGFYWGRSGTTGSTWRIKAFETSSTYIDFNHVGQYITYRVVYSADGDSAKIFYFNEVAGQWVYLLESAGSPFATETSYLRFGDWSSSMGSRWQVDYLYWTNDGAYESEPLYCGGPGVAANPLSADLNGDCFVEWADFGIFASQWQECNDPETAGCTP